MTTDTLTEAQRSTKAVPLDLIEPDPRNPGASRITEEDLRELANSLLDAGLQQPIKLRPMPNDRFQIVYGERRFQAAKLLGWDSIDAEIEFLSDAEAGALQAIENGQRKDVDVFAVAQHLLDLTSEQADGSEPLTQAEAGECYGIKQAEVSNRIRMLRLPDSLRDLVRSGKLPNRTARELLPWADCKPIMDQAAAEIADCVEAEDSWSLDEWLRYAPEQMREIQIRLTRPMQGKHQVDWQTEVKVQAVVEDHLDALDIHELPDPSARREKGKQVPLAPYALNVDLWEELHAEAIEKAREKVKARASRYVSPGRTAKPKENASAAEKAKYEKQKQKQRNDQLAKRAKDWQLRLLRLAAARAVAELPPDSPQLGRWTVPLGLYALHCTHNAKYSGRSIAGELLCLAAAEASGRSPEFAHEPDNWSTTAEKHAPVLQQLAGVDAEALPELSRHLARFILWPVHSAGDKSTASWLYPPGDDGDDDPFSPPSLSWELLTLTPAAIVQMAGMVGVDYEKAWRSCATQTAEHELFRFGLSIYRRAELESQAKKLKHKLKATKASAIADEIAALHNGRQWLPQFGIFKAPAARQPVAKRRRVTKKARKKKAG